MTLPIIVIVSISYRVHFSCQESKAIETSIVLVHLFLIKLNARDVCQTRTAFDCWISW